MRTMIECFTPLVAAVSLCLCLILLPLPAQASESTAGDWKMTQGKAGADDTRGEPPAPRISPAGGTYFTEQTVTIHLRVMHSSEIKPACVDTPHDRLYTTLTWLRVIPGCR